MFEFIQKSNKFAKCDEKILNEINKNTNQERLTELSTQMDTEKSEEDLEKELSQMKYPEDAEKIRMIAKEDDMPKAVSKAIEMLPIEKESEFIKNLYEQTDSIITKISIINKLSIEDEREFFEKILRTGDIISIPIRAIARKLDAHDPLLDKMVCPKCGTMDSMHLFDEYRRSIDLNVRGYRCNKCGYESEEQDGLGELKNPLITLREFMNNV